MDGDLAQRVFQLRSCSAADFGFAWSLYENLMKTLTVELIGRWNEPGQKRVVEQALTQEGTSIIIIDGSDVGWLHVAESSDAIYLGHTPAVARSRLMARRAPPRCPRW